MNIGIKLLIVFLLLNTWAFSQNVMVKEGSAKILDVRYPGFSASLDGESKAFEGFLKKEMRAVGKLRERNTYFEVFDMEFMGNYLGDRAFYIQHLPGAVEQRLWFGVDTVGLEAQAVEALQRDLEKFTYQFCINYYRFLAQEEIDETEKAEQIILRKQNRLERDSLSLQNKLEANSKELIRLLEAIEANKAEKENLLKSIEQNKLDQDSIVISLEKIRALLEKQRQKKEAIK